MKMKQNGVAKIAALLSVGLFGAAAMAVAQTSVYYTSGAGVTPPVGANLGGNLASIGFDSYTNSNLNSTPSNGVEVGTANDGFGFLQYQNYTLSGLPATSGGLDLTSVTFYLYVNALSPNNFDSSYEIYDSLTATGLQIGTLNMTPSNQSTYISFTIPASVLAGGFSIATNTPDNLLNFASEDSTFANRTPLVVANYAVPEPSTALLGAVTALGLLRRRRA